MPMTDFYSGLLKQQKKIRGNAFLYLPSPACLPTSVNHHVPFLSFFCSCFFYSFLFKLHCAKGFQAFRKEERRRIRSARNRWVIKGCSGEGTRGLKVQIQAISECIRSLRLVLWLFFLVTELMRVCSAFKHACSLLVDLSVRCVRSNWRAAICFVQEANLVS